MGGMLNDLGLAPEFFQVFVETGTYLGETTQVAAKIFKRVYTIELSREIYLSTRDRLKALTNVEFINGDSSDEVARLSSLIDEPAVFFLDAHFAGGQTAFGNKEVPLYEELTSIAKRTYKDLIIMDDFRLFAKTGLSGSKGNAVYPLMQFDWRDITLEKCVRIFEDAGKRIEHIIFDDRVYLLQFGAIHVASVPQQLASLNDLQIGKPHPVRFKLPVSSAPPRSGVDPIFISPDAARQSDGFSFESAYGKGIAITPGTQRPFELDFQFDTSGGSYEVWLQYAAGESRPLELIIDDLPVIDGVAALTTGGWYERDQTWQLVTTQTLAAGSHHLRLRRNGWFPPIGRLALLPIA